MVFSTPSSCFLYPIVMAHHELMLDAPDTLNGCIFKLQDSSAYADGIAVTCPRLSIQSPGFTRAIDIPNPQPGFMYNLTACDLGIQTQQCGTTYFDIPDGIYILKYSVSPNDFVYVEYNYLRITKALNIIQSILCDLDVSACVPDSKNEAKLRDLHLLQMQLLAAKAKVETCLEPKTGWEIYLYVIRMLDKLRCCTTSCRR